MIITDEKLLRVKCEPVLPEEIGPLRELLEKELINSKIKGIGLAAPQIGIHKNFCIVRSEANIDLVNCRIEKAYDKKLIDYEGCLSFSNRFEKTLRYQEVYVVENAVEPYSFICTGLTAVAVQHECLPHGSVVETEHGPMTINHIVNNKIKCKVWCIDENNNFILSPVIGWYKNKNYDKKWITLKLSYTGPNKQLKCTEDHKCATIDDILFVDKSSKIKFKEAKYLKNKYIVRFPICRERNSEHKLYNKYQMSAIIGGVLGDMHISMFGQIMISHGEPQERYAKYKANILNGEIVPGYSGYRKEYSNTVVLAPITEQTKLLRKMIYFKNSKTIKNIVNYIDPIALAFWYMDDGCLIKYNNRNTAQFHTEGLHKKDVILLSKYLKDKYGIYSYISPRKLDSGTKYILCLNVEGSKILFKLINKYMHNSIQYKLPKEYRNKNFIRINNERIPFAVKYVSEIKNKNLESYLYDLEIEKYHNFIANNTVVHNCDHLSGILLPDVALPKIIEPPKKVGPNDLCPCGSNKKYKKCCGKF